MFRRLAVVFATALVAGFLAAGAASAASADGAPKLTAQEKAGLHFAGEVMGSLFGSGMPSGRSV